MLLDVPDLVLIGGGGHARMLIDALQAASESSNLAILDADPLRHGTSLLGVPIIGTDVLLPGLAFQGTKLFAVAVGGTRDNAPRARLFERSLLLGLSAKTIVHPRAIVSAWAQIGEGCQILPGAVVNAGAHLGRNVIVNTAAVVEHDCRIGDHVHVATGARLAGSVTVGCGAHIGAGAVILQKLSIGFSAVVGAGAVVLRDVSPAVVVAGVPARELYG